LQRGVVAGWDERMDGVRAKTLVVENFKSYKGVQRIGPFDQNAFTAVIGPNGSGERAIFALLGVFARSPLRSGFVACRCWVAGA
jgi:ABC-type branched-subunit amino acid transport system ATPase component